MIIYPIERTSTRTGVRLSARIEWEHPRDLAHAYYDPPETLWFEFPEAYADVLSESANSFVVPLVAVAMSAREDIYVHGTMSRELAHTLEAYQQMLCFWFPEWYSKIAIRYETLAEESAVDRERGSMCSFSGGVDSSYTWWSHLSGREEIPAYQVTHALYIEGLDAHGELVGPDPRIEPFTELLERYGTKLIPVNTNARAFLKIHRRGQQIYTSFGSILAAAALFFDRIVARYYVAPDTTYDFPILYDMIATSASLLSTETMDVVRHGGAVSKIDKIRAITPSLPLRDHLFVCWDPSRTTNCGECLKCSYTMALLDIAGVRSAYRTFPPKTDPGLYRRYTYPLSQLCYLRAWISYAQAAGRYDIARDYRYVLWASRYSAFQQYMSRNRVLQRLCDPLAPAYLFSHKLKQRSARYARFIARLKGQNV